MEHDLPPLWIQALLSERAFLDSFLIHLALMRESALSALLDATDWGDVAKAKGRLEELQSLQKLCENYRTQEKEIP